MTGVYIYGAKRTPIGKFGGQFRDIPAPDLGAFAIQGALEHAKTSSDKVQAVHMGCVLSAGLGQAPARQVALKASLSTGAEAMTVNKVCGSGLQAIRIGTLMIQAGLHDVSVAGGIENMSRAPYLLPQARWGTKYGHGKTLDHLLLDGLEEASLPGTAMGQLADKKAAELGLSRSEQDHFAAESSRRAHQAQQKKIFDNEISPVSWAEKAFSADELPPADLVEKLPRLKPAFVENGTVTAGNASSLNDGAAAVVLGRKEALNLTPLAHIVGISSYSQKPEDFTTAPIGALEKLFQQTGWTPQDVDLFEINEAFAMVPLSAMQSYKIPHEKVNVLGGSCVLGHPIGASGARIVVTLLNAMSTHGAKRGVAAICIGGGESLAIALEKV